MKKLLSLVLCVLLTLSLTLIMTGCGNRKKSTPDHPLLWSDYDVDDYDNSNYDDDYYEEDDDDKDYSSDAKRIIGNWILEFDFGILSAIDEDMPDCNGITIKFGIEFKKNGQYHADIYWDSVRDAYAKMLIRYLEEQGSSIEEFEEEQGISFEEYMDKWVEIAQNTIDSTIKENPKKGFPNGYYEIENGYLYMEGDEEPKEYKFKGDDTLIIYLGEDAKIEKFTLKRD